MSVARFSKWCYLWGIKLQVSKTKTMIISRSNIMHCQSHLLTISRTVLEESDVHDILGVTSDYKMAFDKHIHSVSRAATQRVGILRKQSRVFHDRLLLGRCFQGFVEEDLYIEEQKQG